MYLFQPTLPVRGATLHTSCDSSHATNFNPRSPCGERQSLLFGVAPRVHISTHAPRAGSDLFSTSPSTPAFLFQPTLPVRGATCVLRTAACAFFYFNPRSPCGERRRACTHRARISDFNPRSPCGERPAYHNHGSNPGLFQPTLPVRGATVLHVSLYAGISISTHAPRAGSDSKH